MSRRHRARAQRTRDRPRASSRAPPSRMNPRLERDDRPRERINTRRRHARARRSIETDRVTVSRTGRPRMRARDDPRRITRRHQSSSIERSIERSSPPASSRRERTHKEKKTKKNRRRDERPMSLVVVVVVVTPPPPPPSPRAVFDAHTRTDRPRASDRPRVRPTARRIIRPTDRPTAFFFLFFFERPARPDRARECVSG